MKNVLCALSALLLITFASSCVAEKIMPLEETVMLTQKVDTIIVFEETIEIVKTKIPADKKDN